MSVRGTTTAPACPYQQKRKSLSGYGDSDKLNTYLDDINKQAQERFEWPIEGMKQAQGITERPKAENALEWVGRMNTIRVCAREIVEKEIIYT